ncbi:MAG: hypothetical protein KDA61_12875 [Planctomycetales bacterium]|nr:hypothetical protein [Planctomycetales bacterium]
MEHVPDRMPNDESPSDDDLEREILEHSKFSLVDAIGRLGGGDLMKGASPVTPRRQAELVVDDYLEKHLRDIDGSLAAVLLRRVIASQLLLEREYERPLAALGTYCRNLLEAPGMLFDFVREVDAEWGRMYRERPRFDAPGRPPADDDPYTTASVERRLGELLAVLASDPSRS